jgi:hypothetical protein
LESEYGTIIDIDKAMSSPVTPANCGIIPSGPERDFGTTSDIIKGQMVAYDPTHIPIINLEATKKKKSKTVIVNHQIMNTDEVIIMACLLPFSAKNPPINAPNIAPTGTHPEISELNKSLSSMTYFPLWTY